MLMSRDNDKDNNKMYILYSIMFILQLPLVYFILNYNIIVFKAEVKQLISQNLYIILKNNK